MNVRDIPPPMRVVDEVARWRYSAASLLAHDPDLVRVQTGEKNDYYDQIASLVLSVVKARTSRDAALRRVAELEEHVMNARAHADATEKPYRDMTNVIAAGIPNVLVEMIIRDGRVITLDVDGHRLETTRVEFPKDRSWLKIRAPEVQAYSAESLIARLRKAKTITVVASHVDESGESRGATDEFARMRLKRADVSTIYANNTPQFAIKLRRK